MIIGSHVSYNKDNSLLGSVMEALSYDANAFMIYTGAPQNTQRFPINIAKVEEAKSLMDKSDIDINNLIVHAPYIINLANDTNIDFSVSFLKQEIRRCESLGINKLVLHPGSHVGKGVQVGLNNIIEALNKTLEPDMNIIICLETMAGKGSELGTTFEELKYIIDNVKYKDKMGICMDTCHMHDAGYDISAFDDILDKFDSIIGMKYLKCIHINDSKNIVGSHKDRHENIGYGTIGFDNLINVIYNPRLENIPKILETPYVSFDDMKYPPYKYEILMIKEKRFNKNLYEDINNYYK